MHRFEKDSSANLPHFSAEEAGNYYAFFDKPVPGNLTANRSGVLSPQQKHALEQKVAHHKSTLSISVGMIVCAALFMVFLFWMIDRKDGIVSIRDQAINGGVIALLVGVFAAIFIGDCFVFFMRDDLEEGRVEFAAGKVVWNGRRYQMQCDSRRLRSLRAGVALPPPGSYRFYYLPRTGLVVMAEEIGQAAKDEALSVTFQALAGANSFSLEDLAQNQKGSLSRRQEDRLFGMAALSGLVLVVSAALFVSMTFRIAREELSTTFLLLLIIGAVLMLRFGWNAAQLIRDIWSGEAISMEGSVGRQTRRSRYSVSYYYVLGSDKFQVSHAAYNALVEGKPYRIYYVPRSKQLVSIEPLETQQSTSSS